MTYHIFGRSLVGQLAECIIDDYCFVLPVLESMLTSQCGVAGGDSLGESLLTKSAPPPGCNEPDGQPAGPNGGQLLPKPLILPEINNKTFN